MEYGAPRTTSRYLEFIMLAVGEQWHIILLRILR